MTLDINSHWQTPLSVVGCDSCDQLFLAPDSLIDSACPSCPNSILTVIAAEDIADDVLVPPELVVPFTVSAETVADSIQEFGASYYFTPRDLTPYNLQQRMQKVLLPMYLVDSDVETKWQAEVGYDYDVVSHVEKFQNKAWHTIKKNETRVRWEPRTGTLSRHYSNVRAPALESHEELIGVLGKFQAWQTEPYSAEMLENALVQLPDRDPQDAWVEAEPLLLKRVEKECQAATDSQHIRQFHWAPAVNNKHWTKLLLPTYTTYYLDDDGNRVGLTVHGRSGRLTGEQVPSRQLAKRTAIALAIAAAIFFCIYLIGFFFASGSAAPIFLVIAVLCGLASPLPFIYINQLQHRQSN